MSAPPPLLGPPPMPPLLTPAEVAAAAALGEDDGGGGTKRRRLPSFKLRKIEAEEMELSGVAELLYAPPPPQPKRKCGGGRGADKLLPKPKRSPRGFHPYTSSFRGACRKSCMVVAAG